MTQWFARLNDDARPGACNRVLTILNNMLNKAEQWSYRLENTNPAGRSVAIAGASANASCHTRSWGRDRADDRLSSTGNS